eukprot:1613646-Prymnesium_polylepis.1
MHVQPSAIRLNAAAREIARALCGEVKERHVRLASVGERKRPRRCVANECCDGAREREKLLPVDVGLLHASARVGEQVPDDACSVQRGRLGCEHKVVSLALVEHDILNMNSRRGLEPAAATGES